MAFQLQKIHPLDLQPRKAVGVSLPFSSKSVFNSTYTTQEALKSNLINYLLTGSGERFLNPNFGTSLRTLLFEQLNTDTTDELEHSIRSGISNWFPNIIIDILNISPSPDTNTVLVSMKYSVASTNIQDQLTINFAQ